MFFRKILNYFFGSRTIKQIEMLILLGVKECIREEWQKNYILQIEEINYITRLVNETEILFYNKQKSGVGFAKDLRIGEASGEKLMAKCVIVDLDGRQYNIKIWFVDGFLLSLESNRSLEGLKEANIRDIDFICIGEK